MNSTLNEFAQVPPSSFSSTVPQPSSLMSLGQLLINSQLAFPPSLYISQAPGLAAVGLSPDALGAWRRGAAMEAFHEQIDELSQLQCDWDSYGGAAPTPAAASRAHDLLNEIVSGSSELDVARLQPFAIAPLAHGGLQIEWRTENGDLEIEISDRGSLSFLVAREDAGNRTFAEEQDVAWTRVIELVEEMMKPPMRILSQPFV